VVFTVAKRVLIPCLCTFVACLKKTFARLLLLDFMRFLYKNLCLGACLSLFACQAPQDSSLTTEAAARRADDSTLTAQFSQKVAQLQAASAAHKLSEPELAQHLARLPQADMQKVLTTAPDSANKSATISPRLDSTKAQTPLISENAALLIGVRDYQESRTKINSLVGQYQGFINGESEKFTEFRVENTFSIQVPAEQFQTLLEDFRNLAILIKEKKVWREDLAVSWVDVQARLESKQTAQNKLQELLRTNTNPTNVLPIQRELELVQTDLQALNQTAQVIRKRGLFSQITLTIFQEIQRPSPAQAGFMEQLTVNLDNGWANFKIGLLWASAYWVHIAIGLFFAVIYLAVRSTRRRSARRQHPLTNSQPQQWLNQGKNTL
jgi:hypothetical protein